MKTLFLVLAILASGYTSFAQRTIKFEVTLITPAHGSTLEAGATFIQEILIKNLGPDAIKPTDTVGYIDPFTSAGFYIYRLGYTKAIGDTIQIIDTFYFPSDYPPTTDEYCVRAFAQNDSDKIIFDTSGETFVDCNTVTLTPSTGIAKAIKEKVSGEFLNISPNPANAMITFDFVSKGNSEISARVYDMSGRTVLNHNYGKSFAGQHGLTLDISSLNGGLYFVALRQGEYNAVGKLTKQ